MPDQLLMNKYGLVMNGIVLSSFSDKRSLDEVKIAYPDIAPYLMELSETVCDNWRYINKEFLPKEIIIQGEENAIA